MITKLRGVNGCLGSLLVRFMREKWACGDKAVQLSVGAGIVPNNRKRGGIYELDV